MKLHAYFHSLIRIHDAHTNTFTWPNATRKFAFYNVPDVKTKVLNANHSSSAIFNTGFVVVSLYIPLFSCWLDRYYQQFSQGRCSVGLLLIFGNNLSIIFDVVIVIIIRMIIFP